MDISDKHCHTSTTEIIRPARDVMAYLADGMKHNDWALGCLNRKQIEKNLFVGHSLLDGAETYIRLYPDFENLLILADVGPDREQLLPRVLIRVIPGNVVNRHPDTCLVSLITWRWEMSDEQWLKICVSHETEMFIIKSQLEKNEENV